MNEVGRRIKELRVKSGMTQSELGTILGVQKATVQKYEKGTVTNIKPETIEKMADIFGVSPSYLMGWDNKYDAKKLSEEVSVIENLHERFGIIGAEIYNIFSLLNDEGRRKVLFYAEDIHNSGRYGGDEE